MSRPLRVLPFTLTNDEAVSEHVYARRLFAALTEYDFEPVTTPGDADLVHCFEVNAFTRRALETFNYHTLLRLIRSDLPVVVSTDDLYFTGDRSLTVYPTLYELNHYTQRLLFRVVDAVIAISESVRGNLAPYIDVTPIHTVHHGVDDRYRVHRPRSQEESFVLHVSHVAPRKNPEAVIETARRLDTRVVIAGGGWPERVPDDLGEHVEVTGYLPERELIDLYRQAAVFYFPTLHEGFGLPVLEAMAAGAAVVASDAYAVPEVTGDAAVLHDPHDIDAHVRSIRRLLDNRTERFDLAKRARDRAAQFTWERSAKRTFEVYRSVLA